MTQGTTFEACGKFQPRAKSPGMSVNDVLEQVKALPPRERRKFFEGVHELEMTLERQPAARRRIRWPDAAARRHRILGDKVLPNLVLLAREQERY
jgi:hypothetical protein